MILVSRGIYPADYDATARRAQCRALAFCPSGRRNLPTIGLESDIALTGEIIECQRDAKTREVKCVIRGASLQGITAEAVAKLGPTDKLFFITVYVE